MSIITQVPANDAIFYYIMIVVSYSDNPDVHIRISDGPLYIWTTNALLARHVGMCGFSESA